MTRLSLEASPLPSPFLSLLGKSVYDFERLYHQQKSSRNGNGEFNFRAAFGRKSDCLFLFSSNGPHYPVAQTDSRLEGAAAEESGQPHSDMAEEAWWLPLVEED